MFKGILNNPENNYHSYIVYDDELHNIGLGSYTYSSISGYFVNNLNELKIFFNNACNLGNTEESETQLQSSRDGLIGTKGANYEQKPAIIEFTSSNTYEYIEGDELLSPLTSVYELVEAHDNIQNGSLVDEDISTLIYKIQNSLSGCLTFSPIINIHGQESKPVVQVFLKEKNNNSNERKISHKGSPLITEIAKRPTGGKYGWDNTKNINTASGIGIFLKPSENGVDNPKNTVTGNLRLSYNKPLGFWESGTQQILARLLTNLDAAKITIISTLDTIDEVPNEDLYNPESSSYMSQFTIGFALPMSVHNGNPHTFGPNTKEENKKEKIKVVNRSPRKFTKGDVVLCSFIDGEWIVQGFDAQKPEIQNATVKVGRWSFTKLFANSDVLFKDDRDSKRSTTITPSKYENAQRIKYYRHMLQLGGDENNQPSINNEDINKWSELNDLNTIAKLNININLSETEALIAPLPELSSYDIKLNTKYIQSTIFDQLNSGMGGSNSGNLIGRTNAYYSSDGISPASVDGYITYSDMPVFWGAAFPDGYSATQISALKNRSNKAFISYPEEATEAKFLNGSDGTKIFSKSAEDNFLSSDRLFMFADDTDFNLRQLPAEVALNGSFNGKYSYPIESLKSLIKAEIENENLLDCYAQFLNDKNRYSWLANASNSGNLFALDPIAPQRIQFSPLQAEFAVSADNDFSGKANFNKEIQSSFSQTVGNFFGGMFSREEGDDLRPDLFKVSKNGTAKTYKTIPFGEYVKFPGTAPLGGVNIFPSQNGNERSNLVGIIAARNKFTAQKGGTINFTTSQYFGIAPFASLAGGQVDHVSILPIGGGAMVLGGTSNAIRQFSFPQWGALEDSYNDFGTTALHVRVFDQWPDEQTIYDPRYFAILHFNPFNASGIGGNVQSDIKNIGIIYEGDWDPKTDPIKYNTASLSSAKYEKNVDKFITSVDFRIPTAGHPSDTKIDNKDIPVDSIINRYGWTEADNNTTDNLKAILRPESEWRINPIRRGQLLTNGGFRYYKRVIGIKNGTIENGGEGYIVGNELTFIKEAKARVTAVSDTGAITAIKFEDADGNKTYGSGFLPSDFASIVRNKSDNSESGKNAKIKVETGTVYNKLLLDSSPQDRVQAISRLTIGSDDGYSVANGQFNTKLTLIENNDGKYEAFYFFHNDIMHTLLYPHAQVPGFGQYVVLEISAA